MSSEKKLYLSILFSAGLFMAYMLINAFLSGNSAKYIDVPAGEEEIMGKGISILKKQRAFKIFLISVKVEDGKLVRAGISAERVHQDIFEEHLFFGDNRRYDLYYANGRFTGISVGELKHGTAPVIDPEKVNISFTIKKICRMFELDEYECDFDLERSLIIIKTGGRVEKILSIWEYL